MKQQSEELWLYGESCDEEHLKLSELIMPASRKSALLKAADEELLETVSNNYCAARHLQLLKCATREVLADLIALYGLDLRKQ